MLSSGEEKIQITEGSCQDTEQKSVTSSRWVAEKLAAELTTSLDDDARREGSFTTFPAAVTSLELATEPAELTELCSQTRCDVGTGKHWPVCST